MENPLAIIKRSRAVKRGQELKERVLKNREGVLDAMAGNIKGARQCPLMMGQKCIGGLCELFHEYKNIGPDGKEMVYSRCNLNQTPHLIIENNELMRSLIKEQRETQKLLIALHETKGSK